MERISPAQDAVLHLPELFRGVFLKQLLQRQVDHIAQLQRAQLCPGSGGEPQSIPAEVGIGTTVELLQPGGGKDHIVAKQPAGQPQVGEHRPVAFRSAGVFLQREAAVQCRLQGASILRGTHSGSQLLHGHRTVDRTGGRQLHRGLRLCSGECRRLGDDLGGRIAAAVQPRSRPADPQPLRGNSHGKVGIEFFPDCLHPGGLGELQSGGDELGALVFSKQPHAAAGRREDPGTGPDDIGTADSGGADAVGGADDDLVQRLGNLPDADG